MRRSGINHTAICDGWSWELSARELSRQARFITNCFQARLMPWLRWRITLRCSHLARRLKLTHGRAVVTWLITKVLYGKEMNEKHKAHLQSVQFSENCEREPNGRIGAESWFSSAVFCLNLNLTFVFPLNATWCTIAAVHNVGRTACRSHLHSSCKSSFYTATNVKNKTWSADFSRNSVSLVLQRLTANLFSNVWSRWRAAVRGKCQMLY